ncbi:hypothetical protein LV779_14915 [Streptomyces thinghirensis]|nr:hypothetical protein [Streptomyces thinghirensis]
MPSLHAETLNPHIDFDRTPLRVQRTLEPWHRPVVDGDDGERRTLPRVAGVSSFGGGGSNAHVVVAEYSRRPARPVPPPTAAPRCWCSPPRARPSSSNRPAACTPGSAKRPTPTCPRSPGPCRPDAWRWRNASPSPSPPSPRPASGSPPSPPTPPRRAPWHRGTVRPDRAADAAAVRAALDAWTRQGSPKTCSRGGPTAPTSNGNAAWPAGGTVRRVSLPGYPFARERCWFDIDTEGAPQRPASGGRPGLRRPRQRRRPPQRRRGAATTRVDRPRHRTSHARRTLRRTAPRGPRPVHRAATAPPCATPCPPGPSAPSSTSPTAHWTGSTPTPCGRCSR